MAGGPSGAVPLTPDGHRAAAYTGALVGAAVGDGLGAPFEGRRGPITTDEIDRIASTSPLRTTDDTAMTICVAESLLDCDGLDEDHLAATFATSYSRDPHRGYGAGAASLLLRIAAGEDWRAAAAAQFDGRGSFGNGAAMRAAPYGVHAAGYPQHAAELARRAARVTHTHPLAVEAAAAQAAAVSVLVTAPLGKPISGTNLVAALCHIIGDSQLRAALRRSAEIAPGGTPSEVAEALGTGVAALEAVPAAFCAFLSRLGSFADTVRFAISLGGDTDTIASMAGALAGAHLGHSAIPRSWAERAEGAGELRALAGRFVHRL